jgi:hypothetical protein
MGRRAVRAGRNAHRGAGAAGGAEPESVFMASAMPDDPADILKRLLEPGRRGFTRDGRTGPQADQPAHRSVVATLTSAYLLR